MIKCSSCKFEYDDYEKRCPNCGQEKEVEEPQTVGKWMPLTKVKNDIEFEMVKDVLEMANIPVIRSVKGIDGFAQIILGVPIAGIEVLVPEDRFDEAAQLLEATTGDIETEDLD